MKAIFIIHYYPSPEWSLGSILPKMVSLSPNKSSFTNVGAGGVLGWFASGAVLGRFVTGEIKG